MGSHDRPNTKDMVMAGRGAKDDRAVDAFTARSRRLSVVMPEQTPKPLAAHDLARLGLIAR